MLTNVRRSQANLDALTLKQARQIWQAGESPFYDLIQILYGAAEHLEELRRRIFYVLIAAIGGGILAGVFLGPIVSTLIRPAGGVQMIFLHPTDMIWVYMEVILSAAAVAALPMFFVQILAFIRPALENPHELSLFRTIAIAGVPLVILFFALGMTFAYLVMLPAMLPFLQATGSGFAQASWNIRAYFSFVLAVLLWIGAAFETPLVMTLLARLGLVSPAAMTKQWRYAFVGTALVAAVITPTVDPFNMALVTIPLLGLYFLGVLMSRAVYRPRPSASE
jgi:sec-independent protein translocase protein TatC